MACRLIEYANFVIAGRLEPQSHNKVCDSYAMSSLQTKNLSALVYEGFADLGRRSTAKPLRYYMFRANKVTVQKFDPVCVLGFAGSNTIMPTLQSGQDHTYAFWIDGFNLTCLKHIPSN
jgi:hypothetical protein